jgi:hypothetical protein
VTIGYRGKGREAAGLTRKDRVPKLEESLAVMKRLSSGDEVTGDIRYIYDLAAAVVPWPQAWWKAIRT